MFLTKKRDLVGIDVGSSSVKLVQLKEQKGSYALQNVGIWRLPPEAIVDNALMDSYTVVEAIKGLLKSLSIKDKDAASSVAGNSVIIRKISLSAMSSEELEEQIHWEAEQYIPFDINDVHIDFQILESDGHDPSRMNVLLVASKKDIVNDYLSVFNEAGIKLVVVDVDAFAVQNAFELNYDLNPDEVCALINIGASIMNLNVVKAGSSLFTRDVQMGGNLYTEEIQKQFGVGGEEAEKLKTTEESFSDPRLQGVIEKVNENLAMEIRRSLDFYNSNALEGKIGRVLISGGAAKIPKLVNAVSQRLALPVEILNPFRKIGCSEKEFDSDYLEQIGPLMAVAVGLATRRLGDK